jgi:hypothetical protein
MARLSLWKDGRHSNDYKFFDRRISEMFTIGGTGVLVHKYLGPLNQGVTNDATQPQYLNQSEQNIQDLLLLENRDRKYDTSVYSMRGMYQVSDNDFDLSQFGLFLQTGTLFMTFHINDMIETMGRRIMNGDVLELIHLTDYGSLDQSVPVALKRFFVVGDTSKASEGYSPTWWPHLWRCKINPMVDSQEYKDILTTLTISDADPTPLKDILSSYNKYIGINEAVLNQAEADVPQSGYSTEPLYTFDPSGETPNAKIKGYLTADGIPPNGLPVVSGISFPSNPAIGDYCLRLDYSPNRLFRYDGRRWAKIEDAQRTNITNGVDTNLTLRNSFINNTNIFVDRNDEVQPEKQNLNTILRPKADI